MTASVVKLKDVVRNVNEKSDGRMAPFIALEDIESGTGRIQATNIPVRVSAEGLRHQSGDVLFGKLRPYLMKSYLAEEVATATGELLVLRPTHRIDSRFLFYVTMSQTWIEWATATSYGSKMPRTSWQAMSSFRFPLPGLDEQRRVAGFLERELARIDSLIEGCRRLDRLLAERASSCRCDCVSGRMEPGEAAPGPFGDLPIDWPLVPLRKLVPRVGVGVVVDPSTYFSNEGVPFLRGGNIRVGSIDLEDVKLISSRDSKKLWRSRLDTGDVVVVRAGFPGRAAVVPSELDGANCASILVLKRGHALRPHFLAAFFNSSIGSAQVDVVRYGAAQEQINVGHVVNFLVPVPPVDVQDRLLGKLQEQLRVISETRSSVDRQVRLLAERKRALITAAVSGEFDVTTARSVTN